LTGRGIQQQEGVVPVPHQSYQPTWPESEQPLITSEDAEFDADMAYLRGMAGALFEHATPDDLMRIARDRS
jgi:hypothetical protein